MIIFLDFAEARRFLNEIFENGYDREMAVIEAARGPVSTILC